MFELLMLIFTQIKIMQNTLKQTVRDDANKAKIRHIQKRGEINSNKECEMVPCYCLFESKLCGGWVPSSGSVTADTFTALNIQ